MTFMIAIPTLNLMTSEFVKSMLSMKYPMGTSGKIVFKKYMPVAEARQSLVKDALKDKADYIMFIGDDILFSPNDFVELFVAMQKVNADVINGIYYLKNEVKQPLLFRKEGEGSYFNFPKDKIIKVFGCGLDFTLIKMSVFKKLKKAGVKKFFKTTKESFINQTTEDFYFYRLCKKHKLNVYANTGILLGHIDKGDNFIIYTHKGVIYE